MNHFFNFVAERARAFYTGDTAAFLFDFFFFIVTCTVFTLIVGFFIALISSLAF